MSEDAKISELTETTTLANLDYFTILDQSTSSPEAPLGDNAKIKAENIRNYMSYLSESQATDLTDAGDSTLHYHISDRSNASETLTFSGANPKITSSASKFFINLSLSPSFAFYNVLAGHNLLNIRMGDETLKAITSLTYSAPLVTAITTTAHGLPAGSTNYEMTISGASPIEYNGTYQVTETGATTFTYTPASPPGTSPATVPGNWYYPPTCLIVGPNIPNETNYPGLLAAISMGSVFLKKTYTGQNTNHIYMVGQGTTSPAKTWNPL